jgi:group II intron reverse transcriptase/maturase
VVQGDVGRDEDREIGVSLQTPEKVRKLQTALHAKAKGAPSYRFYLLYDKVYRQDILAFAYRVCRANRGAPGVNGQSFADIEASGVERWLGELTEELRNKTYCPQAVRRVWIPKPDGKQRPLGIPTIRDRVVQAATVLVLEPIFEADLPDEQYAYRPGRSALDAIRKVHSLLNTGHREVVDADLSGYFDSIPHSELMKSLARRISDRHMLHLLKMWLHTPVEEEDGRGRKRRTNRARKQHRGTPQGAPISPLLANLYMRRFVLGWKVLGHETRLGAHIVNYADDFVILCRGTAEQASAAMRDMMERLKLTVNEGKTRVCRVPDESFDFLGYTIGRCYSSQTGRAYIGTRPSRKRITRLCGEIREMTSRRWTLLEASDRVERLNRMLIGWANYFRLGPVSKAYRAVDAYTRQRLRQWLRAKHKARGRGTSRFSDAYLYETLGLVRLELRTRNFPWAKA